MNFVSNCRFHILCHVRSRLFLAGKQPAAVNVHNDAGHKAIARERPAIVTSAPASTASLPIANPIPELPPDDHNRLSFHAHGAQSKSLCALGGQYFVSAQFMPLSSELLFRALESGWRVEETE